MSGAPPPASKGTVRSKLDLGLVDPHVQRPAVAFVVAGPAAAAIYFQRYRGEAHGWNGIRVGRRQPVTRGNAFSAPSGASRDFRFPSFVTYLCRCRHREL